MDDELLHNQQQSTVEYTDDNIRHLSDMEHVRTRPGMYIGRLGDGQLPEDGIYVLLKEVIDNSIDEFKMHAGDRIEINVDEQLRVSVRDYGRGIPQGKMIEAVSVLNTGGKYDSKAFKKSVGLNGVGVKAVNALSSRFEVRSYRDGMVRTATFEKGIITSDNTEPTVDLNTGLNIGKVRDRRKKKPGTKVNPKPTRLIPSRLTWGVWEGFINEDNEPIDVEMTLKDLSKFYTEEQWNQLSDEEMDASLNVKDSLICDK